jgi:hypothetical protein
VDEVKEVTKSVPPLQTERRREGRGIRRSGL